MRELTQAITALRPGVDFANTDGTLAGIRWDAPCEPPTQAEVDAWLALPPPPPVEQMMARLGITKDELKQYLDLGD